MIPNSLVVSFGDDCTSDTFHALFDNMVLEGYCCALNERDVVLLEWAQTTNGRPGVLVRPMQSDFQEAIGEPFVLALDDIETWHVY